MYKFAWVAAVLLGLVLTGCIPSASGQALDSSSSLSIDNKGSDTIVNLALAWAEEYQKQHADIRISVTGGGSGIGLASLINQTTDLANASRPIKAEEIALAEKAGFEPVEFTIARDAIAVIVNPKNPIERLTLPQIALIYQGNIWLVDTASGESIQVTGDGLTSRVIWR